MTDDDLRPGLVRDGAEHCTTCGGTREEHDAVAWVHTWLPRRYVREVDGYGRPCVICGDEGHHVAGHDPAEREDDR